MQFLFQSISHFHSFLLKRPSDLEYTQKAVYLSSNKTEYLSFDWDIVYLPTGPEDSFEVHFLLLFSKENP